MRRMLVLVAALFASAAVAQVCDVTYTTDIEMTENGVTHDVTFTPATMYGLPMSDVLDNNKKGKKVLNEASKQQDKGGPYAVEFLEMRSCDGGAPVRADGVRVEGVTLKGLNAINRVALKFGDELTQRGEDRAARGDKHGWDHKKARKTKRDEMGKKKQ